MKPRQPDKEDAIGDVAAARWNGGDLPILSTEVAEGKATPHVRPMLASSPGRTSAVDQRCPGPAVGMSLECRHPAAALAIAGRAER
jgi:hypothetical protein